MTSIEEIVKYQQELLNYQRNQKQIQRETIKLLNSLNSSLSLMSDRLDEFAIKTNMKLDDFNLTPTNSNTVLINNGLGGGGMINNVATAVPITTSNNNNGNNNNKNDVLILNDLNSLNPSLINLDQLGNTTSSHHANKIYLINSGTGGVIQNSAPALPIGHHHHHNNKNDVFILNDLNSLTPSLTLDQLGTTTTSHSNKIYLINNQGTITTTNALGGNDIIRPLIKLDNATICNGNNTSINNSTIVGNKIHNSTTNNTSDESVSGGEASFDESSNEEKETIQTKKKARRSRDGSSLRCSVKDTEEGTNQQRLFNKFVREKVESRLGKDFLLLHEIQEINGDIMEEIKKEALEAYPPINIRPRRAWHLAKASLRCRRRSLRRQKERSVVTTQQATPSSMSTPQSLTPTTTSTTSSTTTNNNNSNVSTTTSNNNNNNTVSTANSSSSSSSSASSTTSSSSSSSSGSSKSSVHQQHQSENKILIEPSLIQPHLTISSA